MDRFHNAHLIDKVVQEWVKARTVDEVIKECEDARVPCGPVQTVDSLLTDPQVLARDMAPPLDYPGLGVVHVPGIPIKMSQTPGCIQSPSPKLGEHNEEVYGGLLGFSPEKVAELKTKGVV
jgi:crotonobetainyl-CoA:carnitine CoA-transferase CaiB-like acyl-CoA transferase